MIRSLIVLSVIFASPVFAQTLQVPVDMPWSQSLVLTTTIVPLKNISTGWSAISGKTQTINLTSVTASVQGSFPAQTTAWTVNGVRLTLCSTGTYVCEQPMRLRQEKDSQGLPISFQVPPGKALNFKLETGLQKGLLTLSLDPLVTGGPISPPTPTPPPVVPPSPPPVASGPSPVGSCMTQTGVPTTAGAGCLSPQTSLIDSSGGVWTWTTRDGVDTSPQLANFGYLPLSYIYIRYTGVLCGFNSNHGDICFTSGRWQ